MEPMAKGGIASLLARKNILELLPYRCARDDYAAGILLDANENAFGPPIDVANDDNLERYPDPYQIPLKNKICSYRHGFNLGPENIFVGVGSDEAIDLLMRIFCVPGNDSILITPPTYGMYKVSAKVNDVSLVEVPLSSEFDLRIPEIIAALTSNVKLIFLCSPGNPTSKALPVEEMEAIATCEASRNCITVIDEAYVDFSEKGSALSLVTRHSNVVVLQTMSKAFGLAAIRCGFCFGPPDVIQLMNNVKAPYNVNSITSKLALSALEQTDRLRTHVKSLLEQRIIVENELKNLDFVTRVYPSDANFLLFRIAGSHAYDIYKKMADDGVVTRYRGTEMHCDGCIRVTIGTPSENQAFLGSLVKTYGFFQ